MTIDRYPAFVPPGDLGLTVPRKWSRDQAEEYLKWLVANVERRTDYLLTALEASYPENSSGANELLGVVGPKAGQLLHSEPFSSSTVDARRLTTAGYAVAADLGLLVARLLIGNGNEGHQWAVLRQPKSDAFYNHPVLTGFGAVPLEPVGGSIAEAQALLRGTRTGDAWQRMYAFWHELSEKRHTEDDAK